MQVRDIAGLAVVGVGLLLILLGAVAAWKEARRAGLMSQASDLIDSLTGLVKALGAPNMRTSMIYFAFGTLLVIIGGVFLGISDLVA